VRVIDWILRPLPGLFITILCLGFLLDLWKNRAEVKDVLFVVVFGGLVLLFLRGLYAAIRRK